MEKMKCAKCGGAMKVECTETHDHGKTCAMKCSQCGNTEAAEEESAA